MKKSLAYSAQQKRTELQKSARHEKELLRFQSIKNRRSQRSFLSGRFLKTETHYTCNLTLH